ncbi:FAD-dependent oxidoreductase [Gammaproteobacteria bacterium AS21]
MKNLQTDIVIVGGGIAGLWMLNTLTKQGYDVLLLEANALGGGQSTRSQGIIHGGIKYALNGVLSQASDAIKEMPARWKACLAGLGEVDLQGVTQLSDAHYLWSQRSLGSKITSFFAKKAMSGRVDSVEKQDYPLLFQDKKFKGNLYRLNEVVLDIPSVIRKLSEHLTQRILQLDTRQCQWQKDDSGNIISLTASSQLTITAQRFIFAAGEGNAAILDALAIDSPQMQVRPLHMVMATHRTNLPIYAHCIGTSSKPLVTLTHHINNDGSFTWYYGGDIAESGLEYTSEQQIARAQELTAQILPWVTLKDVHWQTLRINRAEPKQSALSRPDAAFLASDHNYFIAWPTKLALAPDLSDKVIQALHDQKIVAKYTLSAQQLENLSSAKVASTAWQPQ